MALFITLKKNSTALSIATYIAITVFLSLYAIERTTFSSVYNFSYFSSVTKILRYFILVTFRLLQKYCDTLFLVLACLGVFSMKVN